MTGTQAAHKSKMLYKVIGKKEKAGEMGKKFIHTMTYGLRLDVHIFSMHNFNDEISGNQVLRK